MSFRAWKLGPRTWAGALFALVAVVGSAPRPAAADCAPWQGPQAARSLSSGLELLDRLERPADAMPHPAAPRPCSGPLCSKAPAPSAPAPVPAVSAPSRVETWACLAIAPPPTHKDGTLTPRRREPARALQAVPSIDRPPRAFGLLAA